MKILVIKQTSLGDVLHSTGHVRTIKENYPDSHLVLLTATSSADLYRHNPWVDEMILFDRALVKRDWWRNPSGTLRHIRDVIEQVRRHEFELAFDLQGLARSVLFLYRARAARKFVKGRWWGLQGYRRRDDHAITEMDGVLRLAGLRVVDTAMELFMSSDDGAAIDTLLAEINPRGWPLVIFSPFSRWPSKDWPMKRFLEVAGQVPANACVVVTGAAENRPAVESALSPGAAAKIENLAGRLTLLEFAALVERATVMLTVDSFPMHVACAVGTPVIALFGPTDEKRVGPVGPGHTVIRAPDCRRCDRPRCERRCLANLEADTVADRLGQRLSEPVNS